MESSRLVFDVEIYLVPDLLGRQRIADVINEGSLMYDGSRQDCPPGGKTATYEIPGSAIHTDPGFVFSGIHRC